MMPDKPRIIKGPMDAFAEMRLNKMLPKRHSAQPPRARVAPACQGNADDVALSPTCPVLRGENIVADDY